MHVHAYDQRGPVVKAVVTVAIAVSAVLFAAFYLWFRPDWWIALLYACICLLAIVSVPLLYRLFGYVDIDAIRELQQLEQKDHDEMMGRLSNLKQSLTDLEIEEGARQAKTLNSLLSDFHEVIANRFTGKNLSASTYLNAARRVQNQALQNLSDMVGIGHTIESLKRQMSVENRPADDTHRQLAEQNTRLHKLIDSNKKLFQALTDTSIEVANIEEIGKFERTETLARLNDLADIARQQSS